MMNTENLIPLNERTKEEQRVIATMGGKKSGEVRKARKTLREELLLLLAQGKTQENITLALLDKAANGDTKAFEVIRDTVGEKPIDEVKTDGNITITMDSETKSLAE